MPDPAQQEAMELYQEVIHGLLDGACIKQDKDEIVEAIATALRQAEARGRAAMKDRLEEYTEHDCILGRCEVGEPTPDGGYRRKYDGQWYQVRPVDETPACTCGLDAALRTPPREPVSFNMSQVETWEHTCPLCGVISKRHSIDGSLTSCFHGECGHSWTVSPHGKEPTPPSVPAASLPPSASRGSDER